MLERLGGYTVIYFDDLLVRRAAQENPRLFFDQFTAPVVLDEAALAPEIFPELKRRVDLQRRDPTTPKIDVWITGSNQTLLQKNVRESLAGRASYFDLNTLSLHELQKFSLSEVCLRGGWPGLYADTQIHPVRYLNDLIHTLIEQDIVNAAGIERSAAFSLALNLVAGRVGQLLNASDIAKHIGVDVTTLQSWILVLEQNGLLRKVPSFHTNINQRLIKSAKLYFEDVALVCRLQGWTDFAPLMVSSQLGHIVENLAISEVIKFFVNRGEPAKIFHVRSKEKVEVDLLIELPNSRFIAAEIKVTPQKWEPEQLKLLQTLKVNIIDHWVLTPTPQAVLPSTKVVEFKDIWMALDSLY